MQLSLILAIFHIAAEREVKDLMENLLWVQCDRCEKWRVLPPGDNDKELPEKWYCEMLNSNIDNVNNKCSEPEKSQQWYEKKFFSGEVPQDVTDRISTPLKAIQDELTKQLSDNDDMLKHLLLLTGGKSTTIICKHYFHETLLEAKRSKDELEKARIEMEKAQQRSIFEEENSRPAATQESGKKEKTENVPKESTSKVDKKPSSPASSASNDTPKVKERKRCSLDEAGAMPATKKASALHIKEKSTDTKSIKSNASMSLCTHTPQDFAQSKEQKSSSPASSTPNRKRSTSHFSETPSDHVPRDKPCKDTRSRSSNIKVPNSSVCDSSDRRTKENGKMMSNPTNGDQASQPSLSCSSPKQERAFGAHKHSLSAGTLCKDPMQKFLKPEEKENSQELLFPGSEAQTSERSCRPSKNSSNASAKLVLDAKETKSLRSLEACGKPNSHSSVLAAAQLTVQDKSRVDEERSARTTRERIFRESTEEVVDLCDSSDEE